MGQRLPGQRWPHRRAGFVIETVMGSRVTTMFMNDPRQVENLLRDAAERLRVERGMPAKVRRKIRIRRLGTAAVSLSAMAALIVGAVLVTGTWSPDPIPPSEEQRDEREIVVVREDPSLPEGCGVSGATEALLSFSEALSDGDLEALDRVFSKGKVFQAVNVREPHGLTGETTVDREAVMSYFASRVSQNESYRLTDVIIETEIWNQRSIAALQVSFFAIREADDITGALPVRGAALLDCPAADIYGMSLLPPHPSEAIESWCPEHPSTEGAVVACVRETGGKKSIIFPVANAYSGEEAGGGGRLIQRGRCLYLRSGDSPELVLPIWPPGFYHEVNDGVVTIRDGIGTPVVETGSRVEMAGGYYDGKGLPVSFENEWKPCAPVSSYFYVSYIGDGDDQDE